MQLKEIEMIANKAFYLISKFELLTLKHIEQKQDISPIHPSLGVRYSEIL